ncbi:PD40 domain-containing protein [candidate division WOR-3 bacterium]|nr:PD40 domain-containing protein [candidate division WOR-3 bacterium]
MARDWSGKITKRVPMFTYRAALLIVLVSISSVLLHCIKREEPITRPPAIYGTCEANWGSQDWIVFVHQPWYVVANETLFVTETSVLWLIRPDGKGLHSIGEPRTPDGIRIGDQPDWDSAGNWIVINDLMLRVWKISADGDSIVQITTEGRKIYPSLSPDGQMLAFSTPDSDAVGPRGIRILDLQSGMEKHIYPYGHDPAWSPDGEKLVFCGWVSGASAIMIVDTSGGNASAIYTTGAGVESPSFAPDGSAVVFCTPYGWGTQVWVVNTDGSGARKLTTDGGRWPSWSSDGSKIVYTKYSLDEPYPEGNGELYVIDPDGLLEKRITFLNYGEDWGGVYE